MEKAILKTLIYADIFDYPLKEWEIHKWLIGRKATLRQIEKALLKLSKELRIKKRAAVAEKAGYYFLPKRTGLVGKRIRRQRQSFSYLGKAKVLTSALKLIPWIKLVGISGGLAMENASKTDDIDLFIITSKNRLWISRILAIILLSLTGQRRKVGENGRKIAGKLCINILLGEDRLGQSNKDIYLAHEVLQMRPLWYRDGIYQKYLEENSWAFRFLPNWTARGPASSVSRRASSLASLAAATRRDPSSLSPLADLLENLAKWIQLKIMKKPQGMERIQDGALYFHPQDSRPKVLAEYKRRVSRMISGSP